MRTARVLVAAILPLVMMTAIARTQVRDRDPDWNAPSRAAVRVNPLASHPDAERGGSKLFAGRCATCHGDEGRGTSKGPDLSAAAVQAQTDGALFWKITSGNSRSGMPSFSFLPEPQRWQLVLRLRSIAQQNSR